MTLISESRNLTIGSIIWIAILVCIDVAQGCNQSPKSDSLTHAATPRERLGEQGNGEIPYPNQEVRLRGRFVGVSKNLYTEQVFREIGDTRDSALRSAIALCRMFAFQEAGCVGTRTYSTVLLPSSYGEGFGTWDCLAETNPIAGDPLFSRAWMGSGKTQKEAEAAATRTCTLLSGMTCRPVRCFNSDFDKIP